MYSRGHQVLSGARGAAWSRWPSFLCWQLVEHWHLSVPHTPTPGRPSSPAWLQTYTSTRKTDTNTNTGTLKYNVLENNATLKKKKSHWVAELHCCLLCILVDCPFGASLLGTQIKEVATHCKWSILICFETKIPLRNFLNSPEQICWAKSAKTCT